MSENHSCVSKTTPHVSKVHSKYRVKALTQCIHNDTLFCVKCQLTQSLSKLYSLYEVKSFEKILLTIHFILSKYHSEGRVHKTFKKKVVLNKLLFVKTKASYVYEKTIYRHNYDCHSLG